MHFSAPEQRPMKRGNVEFFAMLPHRQHWKVIKKQWCAFFRIPLGRRLEGKALATVRAWCETTGEGHFYYSFAGEVWYFDNRDNAIAFKLRWHGDTHERHGDEAEV